MANSQTRVGRFSNHDPFQRRLYSVERIPTVEAVNGSTIPCIFPHDTITNEMMTKIPSNGQIVGSYHHNYLRRFADPMTLVRHSPLLQPPHGIGGACTYHDATRRMNFDGLCALSSASRLLQLQRENPELQREKRERNRQSREFYTQWSLSSVWNAADSGRQHEAASLWNQHCTRDCSASKSPSYFSLDSNGEVKNSERRQDWWVCQKCFSKAFASREDAVQHEATCRAIKETLTSTADAQGEISMSQSPSQQPSSAINIASMTSKSNETYPTTALHSSQILASPMPPRESSKQASSPQPDITISSSRHEHINRISSNDKEDENENQKSSSHKIYSLGLDSDENFLTPLHCFVRRHCVEVFCATEQDVHQRKKRKRQVREGQVGIRCPFCSSNGGSGASALFPSSISNIYEATTSLMHRHFCQCQSVPTQLLQEFLTLKAAGGRSAVSKRYWIDSARRVGLVDYTPTQNDGICFVHSRAIALTLSAPPPLDSQGDSGTISNETTSTKRRFSITEDGVEHDDELLRSGKKRKLEHPNKSKTS